MQYKNIMMNQLRISLMISPIHKMERSAQDVHIPDQLEQTQQYNPETLEESGLVDKGIPLIVEETVDDYESK